MSFSVRNSLPKKGNKFYNNASNGGYSKCIKGKPTQKGLNVLCNCVGWACGRFNEVYSELTGYKGMKYPQLCCDAERFITKGKTIGLKVSKEPVVGGIMVWEGKGKLAGHVAFVEKKINSTQVYTSESGYNHFAFANYTRNKGNGNWGVGTNYTYIGCLINPAINEEPATNFLPPKGYWKLGDKDSRIGQLASFMYKTFPAYTKKEALGDYYGKNLQASIKEFQRRTGLVADGMVGEKTLQKLVKYGFRY